jgi:hypothetical protein
MKDAKKSNSHSKTKTDQ